MKTENLKLRRAVYPQLVKLPKGTKFVKQDGFPEIKSIKKYCAFTMKGNLIATNLGNSLVVARKNALNELNRRLRQQNLIWGNDCKRENYLEAIS